MDNMLTLDFQERESIIFSGLKIYIRGCIGEYLTQEQADELAETFRRFRQRPAEMGFTKDLCKPLTTDKVIRSLYLPNKRLKKEECAIFFYNVAPYALLRKNDTARLAKNLMPNFFSSEVTIYTSFTRRASMTVSELAKECGITVSNIPEHTTAHVERVFFDLGFSNRNNNKSHGRK